ncbi:hypothetical protein Tco_0139362 [Tanacetum coccineum]
MFHLERRDQNELNEMKNMMKSLVPTPAPIKAVEERCTTCGSNHSFSVCPMTRGGYEYPVYHDNFQQFQQTASVGNFVQNGNSGYRTPNLANQIRPPGFNQTNPQVSRPNQGYNANQGYNGNRNVNQTNQVNQGVNSGFTQQAQAYQVPSTQSPVNLFEGGNHSKDMMKSFDYLIVVTLPRNENAFLEQEIEEFLESDESLDMNLQDDFNDEEGDMVYLESLLEVLKQINNVESVKTSIEEPPDLELKDLPSHLEYAFLEKDNKLKLPGMLTPKFCTHKIIMEDDFQPEVQMQRRVNPKLHDLLRKRSITLLDAGLIYPLISIAMGESRFIAFPKKENDRGSE